MTPEDWEQAMQRVAERHLQYANEWLWEEEDGEHAGMHGESPECPNLAGPYCGCDTCVVREVLWAAWPYMYRLAHHPETVEPLHVEFG
jgi:hypothetical protein